jgi:hypothetical protein
MPLAIAAARTRVPPIQRCSRDIWGKSDAVDDALASFAMTYAVCTQNDYDPFAKSKRKSPSDRQAPQ